MSNEHSEHGNNDHGHESYEQAQERFLRVFCDRYFPAIFDLAISAHSDDAISLLGFSARGELQSPKFSELTMTDFWQAMINITPALLTATVG